jgi:hypothetical protein
MKPRYFISNAHGQYAVKDRNLHNTVIAVCLYREQAQLVMVALNNHEYSKTAKQEIPNV